MRVSLCTIARNEEKALKGLLRDFRDQNYPHRKIEVIMIDSGSTDHTRDVMEEFQNTDNGFYDVKIYNSYGKNQASAWNVAIEHATGDIIIRVDAHSKIPRQFVSRNVFNIQEGEDIVGGGRPNICANPNPWPKTLLAAEESLFTRHINGRYLPRSAASTRIWEEPRTTSCITASDKPAIRCAAVRRLSLFSTREAPLNA